MKQSWGFLTNHALVMIYVVRHNGATVREISAGVGVTERATLAILRQLHDEQIIHRQKEGRRTTYSVYFDRLAVYRREGTVSLTPRSFVDGLIRTLLTISDQNGTANAPTPAPDSGALDPVSARGGSSRTTRSCCWLSSWTARRPCARSPHPSG